MRAESVGGCAAAALAADLSAGAAADAAGGAAVVPALAAAACTSVVRLTSPTAGVRAAVAAADAAGVDARLAREGGGWVVRVVGRGLVFGGRAPVVAPPSWAGGEG